MQRLGLLKCKQQTAGIIYTIRVGAGGSDDVRNGGPAFHNADAVNGTGLHGEVCVSIPKLRLESGKEAILTLTPCDDDLDACNLIAA